MHGYVAEMAQKYGKTRAEIQALWDEGKVDAQRRGLTKGSQAWLQHSFKYVDEHAAPQEPEE